MITEKNVVEQIYANPALFYCGGFDEENLRLFAENMDALMPKITENWKPSYCSFANYVIAVVRAYAKMRLQKIREQAKKSG